MLSVPTFLSAILLIYLFAVEFRWLPATGYIPFEEDPVGNLRFLVLPALTLALAEWPGIMRVLRSDMIATLQEDFIALAKAKGLKSSRILLVLPALTLALAEWPGIMRVLRSDMIATLQEDFIALAKAKGLKSSRILFVHALKPSSLTLITVSYTH